MFRKIIFFDKDRNFYMERVRLQFPEMSKPVIENFDNYFSEQKFQKSKKKTILRDWAQEKIHLKNLAEEQIMLQMQKQIDSIVLERKRLETVMEKNLF